MNRIALARHLARQGFVVIPLLKDGKTPAVKWKRFQAERPTDAELVEWFHENTHEPAIVTGKLSGITVIDCDSADTAVAWQDKSPVRQTTKRGLHYVYKWSGERNTVRVNGIEGVDRRGEGGYVRVYPESTHWWRHRIEEAPTLPESHCGGAVTDCDEMRSEAVGGWRQPRPCPPEGSAEYVDYQRDPRRVPCMWIKLDCVG